MGMCRGTRVEVRGQPAGLGSVHCVHPKNPTLVIGLGGQGPYPLEPSPQPWEFFFFIVMLKGRGFETESVWVAKANLGTQNPPASLELQGVDHCTCLT